MGPSKADVCLPSGTIDPRIRHAMRVLENEQSPLPQTDDVAARVGLSRFHFVRLFAAQIGMTPQDYGRSIIMMHAAGRIRYSADRIAVVARDFGYAKQATFNKAFTRHHGIPPAAWRRKAHIERVIVSGRGVRLKRLPSMRCWARRYLGPRQLTGSQWADFLSRLPPDLKQRPRLGFAYDDPSVTPPARIRHDCAVAVEDDAALPQALIADGFEMLQSPPGLWAICDVAAGNIGQGYRTILDGWFAGERDYALEGDPFLERYHVMPEGETMVSICVRVRRIETEGDFNMVVMTPEADVEDGRSPPKSLKA